MKQDQKYTEILQKLVSQNNNEETPAILNQAFNAL